MAKEKKKMGGCAIAAICVVVLVAVFACILVVFGSVQPSDGSGDVQQPAPAVSADQGKAENDGKVLYDGDDMKVTFGSLVDGGPAGIGILSLEVENKTGQDVSLIAEQGTLVVNDYNIDSMGGAEINAGKKAIAQFTLSFKQANITSLDEIKTISMNLQMIQLGASVDVIAEAPISISI